VAEVEITRLDAALLKKRALLLNGEITREKVNLLRNLLFYLNSLSKKEIRLIIDTRGGDVISALKFYDAILLSLAPLACIVNGECSSSGVAILQASQKRLMTKYSFIYLHPVSIYFQKEEFAVDKNTKARFIDRIKGTRERQRFLYDIITKRTGLSLEEIKAKEGRVIFAKKAKELNLIDEVLEEYEIF